MTLLAFTLFDAVGIIIYVVLFLIALWGAFCVVMVWSRVAQKRFKTEEQQLAFLEAVEDPMLRGDFDTAVEVCEGDRRAMCQLTQLALLNRQLGYSKVKQMVLDRFQRDVLADLEHRLSWVGTVIKTAPMVGLLGTVIGMMGAFASLAGGGDNVDATKLAEDIQFALITTACGLAIAIPLVLCTASINVRIRKMEDLCAAGMTQFLESFRNSISRTR